MADQEQSAFQKALSNFIHDFASGGAIRHLADAGLTVTEITERISFPVPKNRVAEAVWKYYLETGKVRLEAPEKATESERNGTGGDVIRKVTYVKEQNAYGRVSMRQVVEEIPVEHRDYIPCDFGKRLYRDKEKFLKELEGLSAKEKQYILDLPWPLQTVYHEADERMLQIKRKLAAVEDEAWK